MSWKKFLIVCVLTIVVKQFLWSVLVPLWEAPDEQAHVARLNYRLVEKKATFEKPLDNTSSEIVLSERLLGTERNNLGNNMFTYHPEYKLTYTNSQIGQFEEAIQRQPLSSRTLMVKNEAAGYPPLYYQISEPLYRALYQRGLIDRVFAIRLISLVLHVATLVIAFYVARVIWSKNNFAVVVTTLVAFQPMVSFVAAGFHPDNLLNLLTTLLVFVCALLIKNGFKWKYLVSALTLISLGIETKQFMFFVAPSVLAAFAFQFFKNKYLRFLLAGTILIFPVISFALLLPVPNMPRVTADSPLFNMSFIDYLKFRLPRLLFEIHPWYWGVFKWLGVTLDPTVMKIITRVVGLAGAGLAIGLILRIVKKRFETTEKVIVFFLVSCVSYVLYMFLWDWRLMQESGFSLGLQGRYLLPLVVVHMILLLYGLTNLFSGKIKEVALFLTAAGMIALNVAALLTVARSYYSISSFGTFILQASQYKPAILKGDSLKLLIFAGIFLLVVYLFFMFKNLVLRHDQEKNSD